MASKFAQLSLLLMICVSLSGCLGSSQNGYFQASQSETHIPITDEAADYVVSDLIPYIQSHIPVGLSVLHLKTDGSGFGVLLSEALREKGYALSIDREVDEPNSVTLAYQISSYEDLILVRLISTKFELARSYKNTLDGVRPNSPLSILSSAGEGQTS